MTDTIPAAPRPKLRAGLAAVLAFIEGEIAAERPFPTAAAIAAHMGWRVGSARDALQGLVAAGCLVGKPPPAAERGRGQWTYRLAPQPTPPEAAPAVAPAPPSAAPPTPAAPRRLLKILKGDPGFEAWLAHYEATGAINKLAIAKHLSFVREATEYPPGHRQHRETALP
jgi:hypothetical protein